MEDIVAGSTFGTLIVFTIVAIIVLMVLLENLRTRLRSIPNQAEILAQQFALAHGEATASEAVIGRDERIVADLERQLERLQAALEEKRQRLTDARNRVPSLVYVLDQIIQLSHKPWLVPLRLEGATAEDGDWLNGRRYLVYGEDVENARRRIEVRFPAREGYRAAEPQPFDVI
jgi:chromosome segregation ATPase